MDRAACTGLLVGGAGKMGVDGGSFNRLLVLCERYTVVDSWSWDGGWILPAGMARVTVGLGVHAGEVDVIDKVDVIGKVDVIEKGSDMDIVLRKVRDVFE